MRLREQSSAAELCRAEINRRNAQHSTGPRTNEGKTRSCQNSFKHGLYSKQLILPGEDTAEFDQLRAILRTEHQPANTTEEMLVDDIAQHFWRLRRFREMEARAWASDDVTRFITSGYLALVARNLASAERSFFRTLAALTRLQKGRGFVPQKQPASNPASDREQLSHAAAEEGGLPPARGSSPIQHTELIDENEATKISFYEPQCGFLSHTPIPAVS